MRGLFTRFETAHESDETATTREVGTKILKELVKVMVENVEHPAEEGPFPRPLGSRP